MIRTVLATQYVIGRALWPELDIELVRKHLEAIPKIWVGDASAGPIARLSQRERLHWLVSPRSSIIAQAPAFRFRLSIAASAGAQELTMGQTIEQLARRLLVG